jgi:Uma2 family endonuclease
MTEAQTSTGPYTWDDFIALEEDDLRELIDGELVEVEEPTFTHEQLVMTLGYLLLTWIDAGHGGRALASGYKIRISDRRGVMPDVQFYRAGNDAWREQQQGPSSSSCCVTASTPSPTRSPTTRRSGRRASRV